MSDTLTRESPPTSTSGRRWLVGAVSLAAVAVIALVLATRPDPGVVADDLSTSPESIARDFLTAYPYDLDRAYELAAEGDDALGSREEADRFGRYLRAVGAAWTVGQCSVAGGGQGRTDLVCPYTYQMLGSAELGFGPFHGADQVTVVDGRVTAFEDVTDVPQGSLSAPLISNRPFIDEVWNPFREWVAERHPHDFRAMYDGYDWRITDESIALWGARSTEYVAWKLVGVDAPPEATALQFLQAYSAHDLDAAYSLVADGVDVLDPRPEEELFARFLEAVGSTTTYGECAITAFSRSEGTSVVCPYTYDMLRSDELGLGPFEGATEVTVFHGRVTGRADASAVPQGSRNDPFSNEVWLPFHAWIADVHPGDLEVMFDGQGWRITDESIPLWEVRIEEYVASTTGA